MEDQQSAESSVPNKSNTHKPMYANTRYYVDIQAYYMHVGILYKCIPILCTQEHAQTPGDSLYVAGLFSQRTTPPPPIGRRSPPVDEDPG